MSVVPAPDGDALQEFIQTHQRLFVLTGAGCSTDSGIPDYRDLQGGWKRPQPVTFQAFMGELATRQRYWARSLVGWPRFGLARPNATHHALAALEVRGQLELLLTQNVDRLHQAAGSQAVIDLHGRLDVVRCMGCERRMPRTEFQWLLEQSNPGWVELDAAQAPDGDADLDDVAFETFAVPPCPACGGILKPDVVFFGENVPRERVERAFAHLQAADAVLVVGSSLMVYSGFRFVQAAARSGLPIAALNFGRTRADELLTLKVEQSCAQALAFLHAPADPLRAAASHYDSARSA
ncbi:NAD-dependent protein deacetylase [Xanthomonas sp. NCPPB 1067]|uniref:NAD-dependent protein deacetylase n=1 Tax=Xanthomonas melonis TaxID=56456 RepID=A0A2S7DJX7_9XANT|nr:MULTISPECIES: NAD-dependent protein deacetylase [Xanthomonas]MCC4585721.1 NAD-dependent protein deacetylase [Xanthomonas sp. NCPPB 1067]MCC4599086.1 NAD-dependent protein deacetylase [Xanthomonas melonis]MCD0279782.1 NAD-dependent protein deacetylase [Xanthomonas melonis]PPU74079.1 NAD-dependent deacetylase [Xanthomonas melonis]